MNNLRLQPSNRLNISQLRVCSFLMSNHLVKRVDIRLGRCQDNVGVSTLSIDNLPVFFNPDCYLTLGIGAGGYRIH